MWDEHTKASIFVLLWNLSNLMRLRMLFFVYSISHVSSVFIHSSISTVKGFWHVGHSTTSSLLFTGPMYSDMHSRQNGWWHSDNYVRTERRRITAELEHWNTGKPVNSLTCIDSSFVFTKLKKIFTHQFPSIDWLDKLKLEKTYYLVFNWLIADATMPG